jgi:acetyl esterase/lipase
MTFTTTDIEYANPNGQPLGATLYRPAGPGPFPAVVEIHGGAWTSGDRFNNKVIAEYLAARGVVVFSIDFRLPPDATYPAVVADINYGIRWFKQRAAEFGTTPALTGALGTSSGGHMLLLNVLRPAHPAYVTTPTPGVDAAVPFAIACWPVADPLTRYQVQQERGNARLVAAHHAFWPDVAAMEEGSPTHILARGEKVHTPPLLIMQGTADDNLTPDMADRCALAYSLAGGRVSLEKFPGEQHAFIPREPDSANSVQALAIIREFIKRHAG